mmetsp:Transcript_13956/g.26644  ORF Transcript_13956/g.26644 Transcript_13956/m.26644 type:complete len:204 (+) Transcript_13956:30-641(+)
MLHNLVEKRLARKKAVRSIRPSASGSTLRSRSRTSVRASSLSTTTSSNKPSIGYHRDPCSLHLRRALQLERAPTLHLPRLRHHLHPHPLPRQQIHQEMRQGTQRPRVHHSVGEGGRARVLGTDGKPENLTFFGQLRKAEHAFETYHPCNRVEYHDEFKPYRVTRSRIEGMQFRALRGSERRPGGARLHFSAPRCDAGHRIGTV